MTTIEIRTRLDEGIYRSEGGGETRTHYTAAVGPLNLLRLSGKLSEHAAHMTVCYGNIGGGRSWIRIGDQQINSFDLPESLADARKLIADVATGAYAAGLIAQDAAWDADRTQYGEGVDAGRAGQLIQPGASLDFRQGHRDATREIADMKSTERQRALEDARRQRLDEAEQAAISAQWAATQASEAAEYAAWRAATDVRQAAKRAARLAAKKAAA